MPEGAETVGGAGTVEEGAGTVVGAESEDVGAVGKSELN